MAFSPIPADPIDHLPRHRLKGNQPCQLQFDRPCRTIVLVPAFLPYVKYTASAVPTAWERHLGPRTQYPYTIVDFLN